MTLLFVFCCKSTNNQEKYQISGEYRVESTEWRVQSGEYRVESTEWRVQSGEYRVESTEVRGER